MEPLLTNFNRLLQYIRKSIWRKYKLFLRTDNFIEEITTTTVTTVVTLVTPHITIIDKNHVALYIIKKDAAYKNILKRSKKSRRLSLEISLRIAFRSE